MSCSSGARYHHMIYNVKKCSSSHETYIAMEVAEIGHAISGERES